MTDFVDIKVVLSQKEFEDAMSVRRQVFVDEQNIAPELEFDGNDFSATHLVAYFKGSPVGTIRLRYFKDFVKIERLCIAKNMRKTNTSALLIESALSFSATKGFEHAHALCKKELLNRWEKAGFFPVENAPSVSQNGMTLVPIAKKLTLPEKHITLETSPDILNIREGEWFSSQKIGGSSAVDRTEQIKHFASMASKIHTLKIAPDILPRNWHPPLRYDFVDLFESKTK
ncbi:MAG: GNAT family N-acetyltransferase [Alphaproteobacteria bacterium]|nr:GNAT family N-acetyltransferase [Alphaproteobacteria bacterium]